MARRVTLLNNKGGVGKTLATVALAEAAARRGARVLVVDMDPQANATRRLGTRALMAEMPAPHRTLTECLRPSLPPGAAREYVLSHGWSGEHAKGLQIDVLPSDLDLEDRSLEAGMLSAQYRLRRALWGFDDDYDLTVIDCPPSIKGHLTVMAIAALDGENDAVVVPLTLEQDGISGAKRAVDYVNMWRADLGVPDVTVSGLVVNSYRTGTGLHDTRYKELGGLLDGLPILATIPLRTRLAELQDAGAPLASDATVADGILSEFDKLAVKLLEVVPA